MSGKNERPHSRGVWPIEWDARVCACGQRYRARISEYRFLCYTCERNNNQIRLDRETQLRYPRLVIPVTITPMDRAMMEMGDDATIRRYCRIWARRTATGSFDMLVIDVARRAHKYMHMSPSYEIDFETYLSPAYDLSDDYREEDAVLDIRADRLELIMAGEAE